MQAEQSAAAASHLSDESSQHGIVEIQKVPESGIVA